MSFTENLQTSLLASTSIFISSGKICTGSAAVMKQIEPTALCAIPQFPSSVLEDAADVSTRVRVSSTKALD